MTNNATISKDKLAELIASAQLALKQTEDLSTLQGRFDVLERSRKTERQTLEGQLRAASSESERLRAEIEGIIAERETDRARRAADAELARTAAESVVALKQQEIDQLHAARDRDRVVLSEEREAWAAERAELAAQRDKARGALDLVVACADEMKTVLKHCRGIEPGNPVSVFRECTRALRSASDHLVEQRKKEGQA